MACANGHTIIVKMLIESGALVNSENTSKNTPLRILCMSDIL
jgi:ankyrin repeat protein